MDRNLMKTRHYFMDYLRILATALVFVLHCAHIFDEVPYHIKSSETSLTMGAIVLFLNYWIMPLFFFIAGGSSYYSLLSRSSKSYISERFHRLIIPFIFGSILFTLILNYAEALNHDLYSGSFIGFMTYEINRCISSITEGRIPFSPRIFGIIGHHLWFLAFLFIYSVITLPAFQRYIAKKQNKNRQTGKPIHNKSLFAFGFLILFLVSFFLMPLDPVYEGWTTFLQWGLFFIFGFLIIPEKSRLDIISKGWKLYLVMGMISFAGAAILLVDSGLIFFTAPQYSISFAIYSALATTASWSWVLFFIGFGSNKLNFDSHIRPTLSKVAMPFYIIHQPVIIVCALFIVEWKTAIIVRFLCIFIISIILVVFIIRFAILPSKQISRLFGIKPETSKKTEMDFTTIIR